MSFLKNMLTGTDKDIDKPDDKTKGGTEEEEQQTEIFEGGHKLTALENMGSSLTTLWSNCALNIKSSGENIATQSVHNSQLIRETNTDIDNKPEIRSTTCEEFVMEYIVTNM